MILFFYVVLNMVAIFSFIKKKKKLHILEIIIYWMVGSYVFQNFSALCYMNFKTLIIPDQLSYALTHALNRIVLYPMLMVTFLHFFLILSSYLKKLLLIISFILLFVGLEWLADFLGVLIHVHWRIWWSFSFWLIALLVLIGFMNVTFDWNEWFFIISTSIIFFLFLPIRKYFPPAMVIIIWVFCIDYVSSIDYFLLATPFKLYYFGDNTTYELSGALFHLFMYPCASLLFLFAYDKWKLYEKKRFGIYCVGLDFRYFLNGSV